MWGEYTIRIDWSAHNIIIISRLGAFLLCSMPVSSVLDYKERVMGGGVNSAGRKKGSRNINTWDVDDVSDDSSSSNEEQDVAS